MRTEPSPQDDTGSISIESTVQLANNFNTESPAGLVAMSPHFVPAATASAPFAGPIAREMPSDIVALWTRATTINYLPALGPSSSAALLSSGSVPLGRWPPRQQPPR